MTAHANELAMDVRGLRKRYGGVTAVDGLDLGIRHGEVFGLLGPNGTGKSTTVEILQGDRDRDGARCRSSARTRRRARARGDRVSESSGRTNRRPRS